MLQTMPRASRAACASSLGYGNSGRSDATGGSLGTPLQRSLKGLDRPMPIVHGAERSTDVNRENKSNTAARYSLPLSTMTNPVVRRPTADSAPPPRTDDRALSATG